MRTVKLTLLCLVSWWSYANGAIHYSHAEFKPKGIHYTSKYNLIYNYYTPLTTDRIIILYFKNDNGVVLFKGLQVSENLKVLLPELVIKYIGRHVADAKMKETHSLEKVVAATKIAVERALDQKYKNALLRVGAQLVLDSSYHRGYCNLNWWMPNYYYDFEPAFSRDSVNDFILNKVEDKTFKHLNYIAEELKSFNYHHDTRALAKWPDKIMDGNGIELKNYRFKNTLIKDMSDYHTRKDTCRFKLNRKNINHGQKFPKYASVSLFGWYATYCNFFASDLQKSIFGHSLWSTNGCGNDFNYLKNNKDFVRIKRADLFKYSNQGFFVFSISTGHINTIFPNQDNSEKQLIVAQAGATTGIMPLENAFNFEKTTVYHYIYLGHLVN